MADTFQPGWMKDSRRGRTTRGLKAFHGVDGARRSRQEIPKPGAEPNGSPGLSPIFSGEIPFRVRGGVHFQRAMVAVARKLAVILHRMWLDGSTYRWSTEGAPP